MQSQASIFLLQFILVFSAFGSSFLAYLTEANFYSLRDIGNLSIAQEALNGTQMRFAGVPKVIEDSVMKDVLFINA